MAAQVRQPGDADSCPRETVLQFVWLFFKHLLTFFFSFTFTHWLVLATKDDLISFG